MILTDKPYIEMPPDSTPLMHYLNIYQLLSILKSKHLVFSSVPLYKDALEATLDFTFLRRNIKIPTMGRQDTSAKRRRLRIS